MILKLRQWTKLKSIKSNFQGDSKAQNWLDGLLKIPFGVYKQNKIMSFKDDFMKKLNLANLILQNMNYKCQ